MAYLILINLIAFGVWGLDKNLARLVNATGGRRDQGGSSRISRIPEIVLLALAVVGGCWGCWAGVLIFRHKTRKPGLLWPLAVISVLNAALLIYLLWS